jgi:hypothetical protein
LGPVCALGFEEESVKAYLALATCLTALLFLDAASRAVFFLHGSQLQYVVPAFATKGKEMCECLIAMCYLSP